MRFPEAELTAALERAGVDFTLSLPCEKIKTLLEMVEARFPHIPLTREEEGVGIAAGAALAGRRPAIFVQSSGVGNMLNALLSLTMFYELPLALFVSQRGVFQEKIAAQFPMGTRLPGILRGAGIGHTLVHRYEDLNKISRRLRDIYRHGKTHAFLLSPEVWQDSGCAAPASLSLKGGAVCKASRVIGRGGRPSSTRYDLLKAIAPYLKDRAVVCNLGIPSKELYSLGHRDSNFYMLGSMGMVTPLGIGVSLASRKEVVAIDGDGSILMNPGSLATAAQCSPRNLTILVIDNGAYGSTGNQATLAGSCVDISEAARGFGIPEVHRVSGKAEIVRLVRKRPGGLRLIHALAVAGNAPVPNIPMGHLENRDRFRDFLASAF